MPICRVLTGSGCQIAPSTYYASKGRGLSTRALADQALDERILRLRTQGYQPGAGLTQDLAPAQRPARA